MRQSNLNYRDEVTKSKIEPRMPFQAEPGKLMSGYLSPDMHEKLGKSARYRKRKWGHE